MHMPQALVGHSNQADDAGGPRIAFRAPLSRLQMGNGEGAQAQKSPGPAGAFVSLEEFAEDQYLVETGAPQLNR